MHFWKQKKKERKKNGQQILDMRFRGNRDFVYLSSSFLKASGTDENVKRLFEM